MRLTLHTGRIVRIVIAVTGIFLMGFTVLSYIESHTVSALTAMIISIFLVLIMVPSIFSHFHKDLRSQAEIEKETNAKETMVASIAHEVKNPLNAIKGANQFIYDRHRNDDDIVEFTGIINEEIDRIERYLNEFLSFSRGVSLNLKVQDIESYLTGIVMLVKHVFPCDVEIVRKKSNIPEIAFDPEQLKQVMINLLYNSKDAIKGIDSPKVAVEIDHDKKFVYVSVRDNGVGIEPGDEQRIFAPFFTTKKEGSGIGLAVSRAIVKKHGGDIGVYSNSEAGTVFRISLLKSLMEKKK